MNNKYLNPVNYINFSKYKLVTLYFNIRYSPMIKAVKINNHKIKFSLISAIEYFLRYRGSYRGETLTVSWIENFILPGDIVWDIGANVGAYSLLMASKFKRAQEGRVYAFEPEASNFYGLNRNIIENQVADFIVPLCLALSDKVGVEKFYLSSGAPGAATHGLGEAKSDGIKFSPVHIQGVFVLSGDYLVDLSPEMIPNHIKIDVDGSEGNVIAGISDLLTNPCLKSILIEISEAVSMGSVEKIILDAGFSMSDKQASSEIDNKIYNYLFVR